MTTSSIDLDEVEKFERMAKGWWSERGEHGLLHDLLPLRMQYIMRVATRAGFGTLKGMRILDVGCGGGVLCEALTRCGALVVGVDASPTSIAIAREHAEKNTLAITYVEGEVADIQGEFDLVIAFEVIEHVTDPSEFLRAIQARIASGGVAVLSTINRTKLSRWMVIGLAENILKLLPEGTHDWNKFITPAEIARYVRACSGILCDVQGYMFNPCTRQGCFIGLTQVNYFASFVCT
ncbi:MAG: bifunctional 2-polyprenyl-6-hydroxyphenol methylase/3-demethylubiquinol 3-O-methyltransferase UbiG [Alphaproteobacteria bacterium]|nr:MAG: bifunctional 2-polyprenyl-6-hydroxyphenol methylase/3-demethylubiquinol 3-O-methyltransferase UbiG [Alphaproteobacteria bacterium]